MSVNDDDVTQRLLQTVVSEHCLIRDEPHLAENDDEMTNTDMTNQRATSGSQRTSDWTLDVTSHTQRCSLRLVAPGPIRYQKRKFQ